jgi:glycerol kinase
MKDERLVVALDVGGHAARALVYDMAGEMRARAEQPVLTRCEEGKIEHDANAMVVAVQAVLDAACAQLGSNAARVSAVGLATQRSSIVCLERETGRPLTPVISWQDRRAAAWLAAQQLDAGFVRRETGLPLSPHYGAGKLRWCLDHVDAVRSARASGTLAMGPLSSFLTLRLVQGRPWLADPCNASRTQLWSLREREWSAALLEQFGVPREVLPRSVPNRFAWGRVTAAGRTLPLEVVTGDQSAVPFASGHADPDTVYINIGTGAFLQKLCSGDTTPPGQLLRSVIWQDDRDTWFSDEGTVNGAGSALQEIADAAHRNIAEVFARLEDWLGPGMESPAPQLFLNGISGLGSPWWVADFPSRFIGSGDFPARMVAVVESIAFLIRRNLDEWESAGAAPRTLMLTGGLSRLDGLCRRIADLSGYEVVRPAAEEATARGLAFLLAGNPAGWAKPAVRRFEAFPNPALRARYELWRATMEAEVELGQRSRRAGFSPPEDSAG